MPAAGVGCRLWQTLASPDFIEGAAHINAANDRDGSGLLHDLPL
jgi:hypothetical protein